VAGIPVAAAVAMAAVVRDKIGNASVAADVVVVPAALGTTAVHHETEGVLSRTPDPE
jgi:hypothetical protein